MMKNGTDNKINAILKDSWDATKTFFRIIYDNKKSFIGMIILLLFLIMALFGKIILPYDSTPNYENRLLGMSLDHPLGTDNLGRDVLRMLIAGSSSVLGIAFLTGIFTVAIGATIGIISGLIGGWVDKIIQVITNLFLTVPSFPILLILGTLITIDSALTFALVLSVFNWGGLSRAVRAQIISLKERDFIQICKVLNLSKTHITFKELLPNIMSFISINFIMIIRGAITSSVGIMILGLANFDPTNWGAILLNAMGYGALVVPEARLFLFAPIIFISLFQLGTILFSDGLDEAINPRLRKN
jgi:peptide/nickel transport system permease protein